METPRKCDSSEFGVSKDVIESKPCKNEHLNQYIETDDKRKVWQLCYGCDRKLLVR